MLLSEHTPVPDSVLAPVFYQLHFALVLAALLGCGIIAGVFFTFSTFVMKALSRLSPAEGMAAMQSINITVLTPLFFGVFLGTAVVCIILLVWSLLQWEQANSGYVLVGSILYLVGSLMVTAVFNVPRNEALAEVDVLSADAENIWVNYQTEWTTWNHVRTITSVLAVVCFGFGL